MPVVSQLFSDGVERPALVLVHGLDSANLSESFSW